MTSPRAPAGWYPDPSDDGVVRYWDGTQWSDLAAAPTQPLPVAQSTSSASPPDQPESVVRERTTPGWATIGMVALTAFLVVGIAIYVTNQVHEPDAPFGAQPADEGAVVKLIEAGRREYGAAEHDLQRDAALETRDESICALLGDGRVENWTGQVYEIDSDRRRPGDPRHQHRAEHPGHDSQWRLLRCGHADPARRTPRSRHGARDRAGGHVQRAVHPRRRRPVLHEPAPHPAAEHRQAAHGLPLPGRTPQVTWLSWPGRTSASCRCRPRARRR